MSDSGKKLSSKSIAEQLADPVFANSLVEASRGFYENCLKRAFESRRDVFVFELLKKLRRENLRATVAVTSEGTEGAWTDIESLSKLRNVVGGRFENIKKKWTGSGFPLREHRGDKGASFTVNNEGWVELSNWLSKHGYESRLRPDKPDCLFQIKPVAKFK